MSVPIKCKGKIKSAIGKVNSFSVLLNELDKNLYFIKYLTVKRIKFKINNGYTIEINKIIR